MQDGGGMKRQMREILCECGDARKEMEKKNDVKRTAAASPEHPAHTTTFARTHRAAVAVTTIQAIG